MNRREFFKQVIGAVGHVLIPFPIRRRIFRQLPDDSGVNRIHVVDPVLTDMLLKQARADTYWAVPDMSPANLSERNGKKRFFFA